MTGKIIYWCEVDSCEFCPAGRKEQYGKFRCTEDTGIVFQQNKDMGVPDNCPYRKRSPPCPSI